MPIITLQRQLRQVGRIRIGEQVPTSSGKTRPAKLAAFRLTSPDRQPLDRAAELWGGTVEPFEHDLSPDRWELYTTVDELPCMVPPSNALSQWFELWGKGGCERRCDGERTQLLDGRRTQVECVCDPDARACKATTRLNLILLDLEALGVWRLESHGYYAAVELAGAAELCAQATSTGMVLPARLRLEQRQRRTLENGKPEVRKFAVPVLAVDATVWQALAAGGDRTVDSATGEISGPAPSQLQQQPAPRQLARPLIPDNPEFDVDNEPEPVAPPAPADPEHITTIRETINDPRLPPNVRAGLRDEFIGLFGKPADLTAANADEALEWAVNHVYAEIAAYSPPAPEPEPQGPEPEPEPQELALGPASAPPEPEPEHRLDQPPRPNNLTIATARGRIFALLKEHNLTTPDRRAATSQATCGRTDSMQGLTRDELARIGDILHDQAQGTM